MRTMNLDTTLLALDVALCARCEYPTGDLACPRCVAALRRPSRAPRPSLAVRAGSTRRRLGNVAAELQHALETVEARVGAPATRLVLAMEGTVGGVGRMQVTVEIQGRSEVLLIDNETLVDDRDERIAWARRTTRRRHLAPLVLSERYRLGDRLSTPDVEALGMLLHARLARAQLALAQAEAKTFLRRSIRLEDEGGVVRCLGEFSEHHGMRYVVVELAVVPADDAHALGALCAWVGEFR